MGVLGRASQRGHDHTLGLSDHVSRFKRTDEVGVLLRVQDVSAIDLANVEIVTSIDLGNVQFVAPAGVGNVLLVGLQRGGKKLLDVRLQLLNVVILRHTQNATPD